jgi:3-phytase
MRWILPALLLVLQDAPVVVTATVETDPVPSSGDAADDPAIWVHPKDPSRSVVIGTDKKGGIAVYDLAGTQIQYLPDGKLNNVDVRGNIVTAGNRRSNAIAIYRIDPDKRTLANAAAREIVAGITLYGSCMYRSTASGKLYVVLTAESGELEQWELVEAEGKFDARKVRAFDVGGQCEGCVADDELGHLYVGEEAVGIWKYPAEPDGKGERVKVDACGAGHLEADVEGLAIWKGAGGKGFLIASSQGDNTFAVYRREGKNEFIGRFAIGDGKIDGCTETDGIDVTSAPLGDAFPRGLFVAQDGRNPGAKQNYKYVPWESIAKALKLE